ncbi:hypothetical protein ACCO45_001473 [Purpureocillium lilacinum]|uniref:Uncharacterized protein n=1 Tax=Purpureocillium lilacinum TaxID=33203 RepID=A0ACC4E9Q1_PURLI
MLLPFAGAKISEGGQLQHRQTRQVGGPGQTTETGSRCLTFPYICILTHFLLRSAASIALVNHLRQTHPPKRLCRRLPRAIPDPTHRPLASPAGKGYLPLRIPKHVTGACGVGLPGTDKPCNDDVAPRVQSHSQPSPAPRRRPQDTCSPGATFAPGSPAAASAAATADGADKRPRSGTDGTSSFQLACCVRVSQSPEDVGHLCQGREGRVPPCTMLLAHQRRRRWRGVAKAGTWRNRAGGLCDATPAAHRCSTVGSR